jgi:hypothetical protein
MKQKNQKKEYQKELETKHKTDPYQKEDEVADMLIEAFEQLPDQKQPAKDKD